MEGLFSLLTGRQAQGADPPPDESSRAMDLDVDSRPSAPEPARPSLALTRPGHGEVCIFHLTALTR